MEELDQVDLGIGDEGHPEAGFGGGAPRHDRPGSVGQSMVPRWRPGRGDRRRCGRSPPAARGRGGGRGRAPSRPAPLLVTQPRGEGVGVAICEYPRTVLFNGPGEHEEALAAARRACADPTEIVAHNWGMIELIEAAARIGRVELAAGAFERLTTVTAFSSVWLSFPQLGADN